MPWFGAFTIIGQSTYHRTYVGHAWIRGNWSSGTVYLQLFTVRKGAKGYVSATVGQRTRPLKGHWQRLSVHGTVTSRHPALLELRIWAAGNVKRSSHLVVDGVRAKVLPGRESPKKPQAAQKEHG